MTREATIWADHRTLGAGHLRSMAGGCGPGGVGHDRRTDPGHSPGPAAGGAGLSFQEGHMTALKAIVVYESHWGNTAAIARAIAVGVGIEAQGG